MTDRDLLAADYLRPRADAPWRWSPDGETVDWVHGGTITFRSEVVAVLRRLADGGLPPFDGVVLVLAACRNTWSDHRALVSERLTSSERAFLVQWTEQLLERLDHIARLPAELRADTPAKLELLSVLFERYPQRASRQASWEIVSALVQGMECDRIGTATTRPPQALRVREIRQLGDAIAGVDAESLRLRLRTGLDQLIREPPPPEEDEPTQRRPRTVQELLVDLERDPELAGLVRLVRNLLAVTYLPRRIDEPQEIAMGGVSDLTNRGPYDRLLLSELAHDDDTLTTRLALSEALYLRRETPPSSPSQTRLVMIDCGIRMWGLPRLFATGVALSLCARKDAVAQTILLRAEGTALAPIDATTREGLVAHLGVLRAEAHPGDALGTLSLLAKQETAEVVLITGDDVWHDAEFRRQLRESGIPELFVFTVNRFGRLRAFRHTLAGEKTIRQATLDIESLLAPRESSRPAPPPLREPARDLPRFFSEPRCPLRIPHQIHWNRAWYDADVGLLSITKDRQLTLWQYGDHGPELLGHLPAKGLLWACRALPETRIVRFVVGRPGKQELFLVTVDPLAESHAIEITPLAGIHHDVLGVAHHQQVMFVIGRRQVTEFSLVSGRHITSWTLPQGYKWTGHGRFFSRSVQLSVLVSGATLEQVYAEYPQCVTDPHFHRGRWTAVDTQIGPVAVHECGWLFTPERPEGTPFEKTLSGPIRDIAVSQLGDHIVVEPKFQTPMSADVLMSADPKELLQKLPKRYVISASVAGHPVKEYSFQGNPRRLAELGGSQRTFTEISLRKNIVGAAISSGEFLIKTRRGDVQRLTERLQFFRAAGNHQQPRPVTLHQQFGPIQSPYGFKLAVARWPDGSRIFLDGRGLLHLVSSDPSIPQVSIVLNSSDHTSGWCSDGRYWGEPYFTPEGAQSRIVPPDEIWETVISPFLRRVGTTHTGLNKWRR